MLDLTNKKVLVTGGSGMIGRHLVRLLKEKECDIYVADLREPKGMDGITYRNVDLTDYKSCLSICE